MAPFLASLARDDPAPATLRGYRYDLRHFLAWHRTVHDAIDRIMEMSNVELDLQPPSAVTANPTRNFACSTATVQFYVDGPSDPRPL